MKIQKKILPEYFKQIKSGKKKFELRLADWECKEGDVLALREWDNKTQNYTGRVIEKKVTYVLKFKNDNLFWSKKDIEEHGLQIISIE